MRNYRYDTSVTSQKSWRCITLSRARMSVTLCKAVGAGTTGPSDLMSRKLSLLQDQGQSITNLCLIRYYLIKQEWKAICFVPTHLRANQILLSDNFTPVSLPPSHKSEFPVMIKIRILCNITRSRLPVDCMNHSKLCIYHQ